MEAWGGVEFPVGFFSEAHREEGARGLVLAVLKDAVRDVLKPKTLTRQTLEAVAWFEAMDAAPFGFRWCADVLGFEPEAFARALLIDRLARADCASS